MDLELDHIFVCVKPNAPEAIALNNFGLHEGRRRTHQGQGTVNVCFFFQNAYLELLQIEFDRGQSDRVLNFEPDLPISFRW